MLALVICLLIAVLLPLVGFLVLLFIGKRLGVPLAGWVGTTFIVGSFASTFLAMVKWYAGMKGQDPWGFGIRPILRTIAWIPSGSGIQQSHPGFLDVGVYVDSLTIAMFAAVTLVAVIIHIFSIGHMRHEEHFARFFAFLNLACFATLGLVIGGTLLHLFIFWQLLSLSCWLLVGLSFEKPPQANAALRTFIIHLVGDCGFLIGLGILFCKVGNGTLPILWSTLGDAASGHGVFLQGRGMFSIALLTWTGICLFIGAIAKSAQFPLHVWMTDAGASPLPGSAMICTATSMLAGVYFVGRLFPILTPEARLFVAIIGLITLTMAALIAMAQDELPRMIAWTAVSQFGYMMLAMGVGSWIGGLFHLMTASFMLALLFLAAGGVVTAGNRRQKISGFGGLWKKLPVTAGAFAIAVLALSGTHLLSGHYSQSIIATDSAAFALYATRFGGRVWGYWLFFAIPSGVVYLTAFFLARCWMRIFAGAPRDAEFYQQAREHPVLWGPLLALAVPTLIAGYAMNVPELLGYSIVEIQTLCNDLPSAGPTATGNKFTAFDQAWPLIRQSPVDVEAPEPAEGSAGYSPAAEAHERGHLLAREWVSWAWVLGIALGAGSAWKGQVLVERLVRIPPVRCAHVWLRNAMYFDELYYWTIGRLVQGLALACYAFDRFVISGAVDSMARAIARVRHRMLVKK